MARIDTAIRMALSLRVHVRAEQGMMECALAGIVNGCAVEVIRTLGMEPEFANLRQPPSRAESPISTRFA